MVGFTLFPVSLTFVCVSTNIRALIALAVTAIFLLTLSCPSSLWNGQKFSPHKDGNAPPHLKLPKVQTVKGFYRKRFDFLRGGFKQTGSWVFQFNLLKRRVIAVSGEEGRQMILREPGLDIYQGTQLVLESIPKGYHNNQIDSFYRRLLILQKSDNLTFSEFAVYL
ncbi:cytochrome P450 [Penicillium lividum]|nr:cytochrome P450 [Penicillium lividum]